MKTAIPIGLLVMAAAIATGCRTSHDIHTTSEVKPIHITIDINIKVDKALDDFFGDIDEADTTNAPETKGEPQQ